MERVVLVTGASGGVGLALCQRLLEEDGRIHLCIACRNAQKSEATRDLILATHPNAQVSTVEVDLGNLASVLRVARELRCRFQRLDFVYLNAGIMPNPHVNFKALWHGLLTGKVLHMLTTAEGIMTQTDRLNGDGLQEVFATNLFGHFILVRQLESLLCGNEKPSRLIWTSSSNARESAFSLSDYQHAKGKESYSSSKYATDLTSVVLNRKFNKQVMMKFACPKKPNKLLLFMIVIITNEYSLVRTKQSGMFLNKLNTAEAEPVAWIMENLLEMASGVLVRTLEAEDFKSSP